MTYRPLRAFSGLVFALLSMAPGTGSADPARDISSGGIVLLFGDSILDCHEGDKRIEVVMEQLLEQRTAGARWTVINEAHGGEYIGPKEGLPTGVSEPLFTTETTGKYFEIVKRHPKVDVVFVNYAANDSKVYSPATFRNRLEALGKLLEKDFPGAILIFSTSMYCDPKHAAPYHIDHFKVPGFKEGSLRNEYLEPYNQQIREFTMAHGYRLADIFRRIAEETGRGNWDLRIRAGEGDPREDPNHAGDMAWFDNIHPNFKGTEIIAGLYVESLTGLH